MEVLWRFEMMNKKAIIHALSRYPIMRMPLKFLVWAKRTLFTSVNRLCHQPRLKNCKFVHLMHNDKFNKPFVDFLNHYFDPKEHLVLCKRNLTHPFPVGPNVIEVKTMRGLDFDLPNIKSVFCHSLFDEEVVDVLYCQKAALQTKAWWMVWGGDFYHAPRNEKHDYVRGHFHGYCTGADKQLVRSRYHTNDNYVSVGYVFPIGSTILDRVVATREDSNQKNKKPLVQINNSCDGSDLQALDTLSKFSGKIRVRVIVSYGKLEFKEAILCKGRELFGADFDALDTYLSPEQYAHKMDEIDVLVLSQNRQQGFGNTLAAMYLGKKVMIRSDVSVYSYLRENGVEVDDTLQIGNLDLDAFLQHDALHQRRAHEFARSRLDENELAERYTKLFNCGKVPDIRI